MKSIAPAALDALEAGTAIVGGSIEIGTDPPVRVWSGHGTLTIDGEDYVGIGDRALAQVTGAAIGGAAQGLTLSLSGVDPDVIPLLDADELRGASCVIRRLIADSSGTVLLDAPIFSRGRIDAAPTEETIGGEATIAVAVEGAARGLGRRGGRMRTDADRRLIKPSDGGMKRVSYAGEVVLYWGGQRPSTAASAIPGAVTEAFTGFRGGQVRER